MEEFPAMPPFDAGTATGIVAAVGATWASSVPLAIVDCSGSSAGVDMQTDSPLDSVQGQ